MKEPVPQKILSKKKKLQWLSSGKLDPKGQNLEDSEDEDGDGPTFESWDTGGSKYEEGKKWREWKSNNNKRGWSEWTSSNKWEKHGNRGSKWEMIGVIMRMTMNGKEQRRTNGGTHGMRIGIRVGSIRKQI
eukprot:11154105-Karenia_brevis.AAC.1